MNFTKKLQERKGNTEKKMKNGTEHQKRRTILSKISNNSLDQELVDKWEKFCLLTFVWTVLMKFTQIPDLHSARIL